METMETIALKVARYDFTTKDGKVVQTDKYIVSLGDFGTKEICSSLDLQSPVFTKVKVKLGFENQRIVIKSIIK